MELARSLKIDMWGTKNAKPAWLKQARAVAACTCCCSSARMVASVDGAAAQELWREDDLAWLAEATTPPLHHPAPFVSVFTRTRK